MLILNDYTKYIMAEYIKDMFDAGMTTYNGEFTEKAKVIHRRIRGCGFSNFFEDSLLYLNNATLDNIISRFNNTSVWILKTPNVQNGKWGWHIGLPNNITDNEFLEIINNNRKIYGLQQSSYTPSEMAKAARLLDDEMQYEI